MAGSDLSAQIECNFRNSISDSILCFEQELGLFLFLKLRDSKADVGFGQGGPYQVYRIRWPEKCQTGRPGGQMRWVRANGPVPT